jgi:putative ABC transport system permease protein
VLSFSVAQRRQEFGVRIALGANRADVLRLVLRQGFRLALVGVIAGLGTAAVATKLMASMLYKTGRFDPATFIAAPLLLVGIALLASYLPAQRATRVSPIESLR